MLFAEFQGILGASLSQGLAFAICTIFAPNARAWFPRLRCFSYPRWRGRPETGNYVDHDDLYSGKYADLPGFTEDRRDPAASPVVARFLPKWPGFSETGTLSQSDRATDDMLGNGMRP
jgi:hypothetical protein